MDERESKKRGSLAKFDTVEVLQVRRRGDRGPWEWLWPDSFRITRRRRTHMNARILKTFGKFVTLPGQGPFIARIASRLNVEGRWEAWIEFWPEGGGPVLRSQRETTQSDLPSIERWAEGVSHVYLQGSLERTLEREHGQVRVGSPHEPRFDGPAPELRGGQRPAPDDVALNPVAHAQRGDAQLRARLAELSTSELRAIALAFHFDDGWSIDVDALDQGALRELIVAGARRRTST